MFKASNKTYISGRKLEQYQQQRALMEKQKRQLEVIPEQLGEAGTMYGSMMEIKPEMLIKDREGDFIMKEEEIKRAEEPSKKKESALEEEDNSDSAEDLDSDDLEDDIKDNAAEILM